MTEMREWKLIGPDGEVVSTMTTASERVMMVDEDQHHRLSDCQTILADLNRCVHGRHAGDVCSGCKGNSLGNHLLKPGRHIGFDISGEHIYIPKGRSLADPESWKLPLVTRQATPPPVDPEEG